MDINVSIKAKPWFEVFSYQVGQAIQKSVDAGMPQELAVEVFREAATRVVPEAWEINTTPIGTNVEENKAH
ncbi:hypothetical protein BCV73_08825 [Paenibacillus sp. SSG-1]|uniref:hypothetical protein n=1 Tax=Paenibacillus sp. SSG-1 TaxID=1443669 RepID=UPI000B7EE6D4|nr:hypothetical protein [Paenibacillus sp. SSG-1]OXL83170.1 hypothetical protein BCV73_08825 [Paenibacillus sp. SSG-1]